MTALGFAAALGFASLACSKPMDLMLPDCVQALVASCPLSGSCVAEKAGATSEICFTSGVHATSTTVDDPKGCIGVNVVTVTKADGTPCYSVESYVDSGMVCEGTSYVWKDAAGQVVATGVHNGYFSPNTSITCAGTQEKKGCDGPSGLNGGTGDPCCGISDVGTPVCSYPRLDTCTAGACAAPSGTQ